MYPVTMIRAAEPRRCVFAVGAALSLTIGLMWTARSLPAWRVEAERRVAVEAFAFLDDVWAAQRRFHQQYGRFAQDLSELDLRMPAPARFSVAALDAGARRDDPPGWSLTLSRALSPWGFGNYTVTFSDRGYEPGQSSIRPELEPRGPGGWSQATTVSRSHAIGLPAL